MTKPTPPKAKRRIRTAEPAPTPKPRNKFPRFTAACSSFSTELKAAAMLLPLFTAKAWTDPIPSDLPIDPKSWMRGYWMNRTHRVQRASSLTQRLVPAVVSPPTDAQMADLGQTVAGILDDPGSISDSVTADIQADDVPALLRDMIFPSLCMQQVGLPYWFAYGKSPIHLLRKARHGDLAAFAQLLRMDKIGFMGDKFLRRLWIGTMLGQDAKARRQLLKAMTDAPSLRDFDMRQAKMRILAVIHFVANERGTKRVCSPADLLDLLDALARDRRQLRDPHFYNTDPDTLGRGIRREQRAFKKILEEPAVAKPAAPERKKTVKKAAKRTPR